MAQTLYQTAVSPSSGSTVTPADWCELMSIQPAGLLASLTVQFPKQPHDGQPFKVTSTQTITALTMAVQAGVVQNIVNNLTTLLAGNASQWVYNAATATWLQG